MKLASRASGVTPARTCLAAGTVDQEIATRPSDNYVTPSATTAARARNTATVYAVHAASRIFLDE